MSRKFPVLMSYQKRRAFPNCPCDVPWAMLEKHEPQALRNHDQSLEQLASRGGLAPQEMLDILHDRQLRFVGETVEAVEELIRIVTQWQSEKDPL
jgi:hypothetical protein